MNEEWIVGSKAITAYLQKGCWKTTKAWIKRYNAPMRRLIDDRPAFLRKELSLWLENTSNQMVVFENNIPRKQEYKPKKK